MKDFNKLTREKLSQILQNDNYFFYYKNDNYFINHVIMSLFNIEICLFI